MPDRKRRITGQDAGQLTMKLFLLLRRQAGPAGRDTRRNLPEAGELGRINGVDGLVASPSDRALDAKRRSASALCRSFGFLGVRRCWKLLVARRGDEVERPRVGLSCRRPTSSRSPQLFVRQGPLPLSKALRAPPRRNGDLQPQCRAGPTQASITRPRCQPVRLDASDIPKPCVNARHVLRLQGDRRPFDRRIRLPCPA